MTNQNLIKTENDGQQIISSTYWGSEYEKHGKIFCSTNAGAIRILLPWWKVELIEEWQDAEYVIISRGFWYYEGKDGVEILFEDRSDKPYMLHLSNECFDLLPGEPEGRDWVLSAWMMDKHGKAMKIYERPARWRRVKKIPYMLPWGE